MENIIVIIAIVVGIALAIFFAIFFIAFIIKKKKPSNSAVDMVVKMLPNVNCGACGREYCKRLAEDIVAGKAKAEECPLVSFENKAKIDKTFRGDALANVKQMAFVSCKGGVDCPQKFEYNGCQSCYSQNKILSGVKTCEYACLGCGDCIKACPFSAIKISEKGVAIVDPELCVGCGNCVLSCPNNLITLIPYTQRVAIVCNNKEKDIGDNFGCSVGCVHCMHCVEICPTGAISIKDGVPVIDEEKCTRCYKCVRVCPTNVISRI